MNQKSLFILLRLPLQARIIAISLLSCGRYSRIDFSPRLKKDGQHSPYLIPILID